MTVDVKRHDLKARFAFVIPVGEDEATQRWIGAKFRYGVDHHAFGVMLRGRCLARENDFELAAATSSDDDAGLVAIVVDAHDGPVVEVGVASIGHEIVWHADDPNARIRSANTGLRTSVG
jgi:hypothetical protein